MCPSYRQYLSQSGISQNLIPPTPLRRRQNAKTIIAPLFLSNNSVGFLVSPNPPFGPLGTPPSPLIAPGKTGHHGPLWAMDFAPGPS